jgi:hypothetical protein
MEQRILRMLIMYSMVGNAYSRRGPVSVRSSDLVPATATVLYQAHAA